MELPADLDQAGLLEDLADWSPWVPFADVRPIVPRLPGVYMARERASRTVVYVGMAGERASSGKPQGLWGRLGFYNSGKALSSGLGEAVFDRAIADATWLRDRLTEVEAGNSRRARDWGRLAFLRADLEIRWATTTDKAAALALERACGQRLGVSRLWNRSRF